MERRTLTMDETAAVLGLSRSAAYRLAKTGDIPTVKLGRKLLVPRVQLERMLDPDAS